MAKGDSVLRAYYGRRTDGVDLFRFAVPNVRTEPKPLGELIAPNEEDFWEKPEVKIVQDQTGDIYDVAIDIDGKGYTYTETDIPAEEPEEMVGD